MFSINTRSRIYFLAVDTRKEMDTWVSMVCKACGLRDTSEEEEAVTASSSQPSASQPVLVPPLASVSSNVNGGQHSKLPVYVNTCDFPSSSSSEAVRPSISSPYIHISECFSGNPEPPLPPPRHRSTDSQLSSTDEEQIYYYMPKANGTIDRDGRVRPLMIPAKNYEQPSVAYIDLDLPKDDEVFSPPPKSAPTKALNESSTIYKTVDFVMTKAFNQTRKDVEEKRLNNNAEQRMS